MSFDSVDELLVFKTKNIINDSESRHHVTTYGMVGSILWQNKMIYLTCMMLIRLNHLLNALVKPFQIYSLGTMEEQDVINVVD